MDVLLASAFTVVYLLVTLRLCKGLRLTAKNLCLGGIMCAATLVLRTILITLPNGSHISLMAMLPLLLLSLVYDPRLAFVSGWITGVLSCFLLAGWQPIHWAQFPMEHLICFSALGYAGLWGIDSKKKVMAGSALAIGLSVLSHILAGGVFFGQFAWEGYGPWAYSIIANLTGHGVEGLITWILIGFMPLKHMKKAIQRR